METGLSGNRTRDRSECHAFWRMRDMIDFGGAFSALRGFSENHVTLKRAGERGVRRCERPAACRGRQRRTRRGGARRRERPAAGAGARGRGGEQRALVPHEATRRFRQRPRQRRRLGRRTRGAQLAKRTHRAAWPYSRARGSAAAAASPRGPSDPPRGGSRSRRRRRGRARCSGRRGGEGSGGGVGRRARAPQRGRRVALPAPRQPLRGRRQSQTGVRGHGTGAPAVAPSTPADVFGTLMLPTGPLAARSLYSPSPLCPV